MYNLTNLTGAYNWYQIATEVNTLSSGLLFTFVMILLTIVYLVVFKKQNFNDLFFAGTFFSAILSTILFALKWVTSDFIIVPWIMFFAAIILYIFNNEQ
jgi:hypothetical protein